MNASCQINSFGVFVPAETLSNDDLAKIVDTTDQWIVDRTGIRARRRLAPDENASAMALNAARIALQGRDPATLTHIIVATCTPDHLTPSVACIVGGALNAGPVMAFDIGAACAGFIYGLSLCQAILCANSHSKILFICAEALTRRLNWNDRATCVLFGDAAAACFIDAASPSRLCSLVDVICSSDGAQKDLITIGGGTACQYAINTPVGPEFFLSMQGRDTYKHAVRNMVQVCRDLLDRNNLNINDVDLLVPHQANMRIIEAVGARLGIDSSAVFTNVALYGNTSAASIPLALAEAHAQGQIRPGALVLATAFGAGLTWGAALFRF